MKPTGRQNLVRLSGHIPAGEDPVTGSAGGCCAAWMVKHAWAQSDESVIIEQRLEIMRPGTMKVRAKRTAESIREVRIFIRRLEVLERSFVIRRSSLLGGRLHFS